MKHDQYLICMLYLFCIGIGVDRVPLLGVALMLYIILLVLFLSPPLGNIPSLRFVSSSTLVLMGRAVYLYMNLSRSKKPCRLSSNKV